MTEVVLSFSNAVFPEEGEDCFAVHMGERHVFACVADGCGGLGSRRYPALDGHTGAYAASRIAADVFKKWAKEKNAGLMSADDCSELAAELERTFRSTADQKCVTEGIRIAGSMQRRLPTTFCAAQTDEKTIVFCWSGDSRGYVLDANGLHQCTRDHLKGSPDPFESLYRDQPLSAYLSADTAVKLDFVRRDLSDVPCAAILATDGVYGALPTPMEMEMLLVDTLKDSSDWNSWQKKLQKAVVKYAQDDATLVVIPCGSESFSAFAGTLLARREALKKQFVTPVRRKRGDPDFARECWQTYRENYDWTERGCHG